MNGIHDLGGMHGFGPVEREQNEPPFHAAWEAAVVAIMRATRGARLYNIDEFRHGDRAHGPRPLPRLQLLRALARRHPRVLVEKGVVERGGAGGAHGVLRRAARRARPPRSRRADRTGDASASDSPFRSTTRAAALRARRRRRHAERPPARAHAAAALRARQARRHRTRARLPRLPRHPRPRPGRAAPARSTACASTRASCGARRRSRTSSVYIDLWESYLTPPEGGRESARWARTIRTSTTTSSRACGRWSRCCSRRASSPPTRWIA